MLQVSEKITFVDVKAAEDYGCQICLGTIQNAVQIGCNDHLFCEQCISQYAKGYSGSLSFPCPICRCPSRKKSIVRVKYVDRQINKLNVKCPNHANNSCVGEAVAENPSANKNKNSNKTQQKQRRSKRLAGKKRKTPNDDDDDAKNDVGTSCNSRKKRKLNSDVCEWVGCYGDMKRHIDACPYQMVGCKWCQIKLLRHHHDIHVEACPLRRIACKQCNVQVAKSAMSCHLENECPLREVPCPQCGDAVTSRHVREHIWHSCKETFMDCTYRKYGCRLRIKRKDQQQHDQDLVETHLKQATAMCDRERQMRVSVERQLATANADYRMMNRLSELSSSPSSSSASDPESDSPSSSSSSLTSYSDSGSD